MKSNVLIKDRSTSGINMKAYQIDLIGTTCIVFADNPPAAKMATMLAARDAGYNPSFSGIRCKRAKWFDSATELNGKPPKEKRTYLKEGLIVGLTAPTPASPTPAPSDIPHKPCR